MEYRVAAAIVFLSATYILFTLQQYFSPFAMSLIFLLALISFVMFVGRRYTPVLTLAGIAIIAYETLFTITPPQYFSFILTVLSLTTFAAVLTVLGIYLLRRFDPGSRLITALFLILIALVAYLGMYAIHPASSWNGVDELAYNYYAASLFLQGKDPYLFSMQQILDQYHISPTVTLSGVYEYAYDYPAFSFVPFFFIPLLGIKSFMSFIYLVILFSVASSYAVYKNSNRSILPSILVWLIATYALVGVITPYLVALLFVIAYLYRKSTLIFGIALGLAASATQLAWFALPFFFLLAYREHGASGTLHAIGYAVIAMAAVNAYFFAASPQSFLGIFSILSHNVLIFYGPNIMQLFAAFYAEPYYYLIIASALVYLCALLLYYLYHKTLGSFLALIPLFIFFISWRNISTYGLAYVPLLLLVLYDKKAAKDALASKRPILLSAIALAIVLILLGIYAHAAYKQRPLLVINSITPVIATQSIGNQTYLSLSGFYANVTNPSNTTENVSFYMISRGPNEEAYALGSLLPKLGPRSSYNYSINYQLPAINNRTELFVVAFSKEYMASSRLVLGKLRK